MRTYIPGDICPHNIGKMSAQCPHNISRRIYVRTLSAQCPNNIGTMSAQCPHYILLRFSALIETQGDKSVIVKDDHECVTITRAGHDFCMEKVKDAPCSIFGTWKSNFRWSVNFLKRRQLHFHALVGALIF